MRINFVLIDSENVKLEYIEKLKHEHFQVFLFVGANLKRLHFPIVDAVQSLGSNGTYIQLRTHGPNAMDFLIAYFMGKLSAANPGACFHIISKDKGFDPLIKHLQEQKITCYRSSSILEIPFIKSSDKVQAKQRAADFYKKRIATNKARPATVTSLQSTIHSHFHKRLSQEEVAKVVEALKQAGQVVVNGKNVAYSDRG